MQFGELILRERLGGEKVERARVRIFEHGVQDGQVVAKRFSGSGRRDDHDVAARVHGCCCCGLVAVEFGDAFFGVGSGEFRADPRGHGGELCFARWDVVHGGENFSAVVAFRKLLDDFADTRERESIFGAAHRERLSHFGPPMHFAFYSLTLARRVRERNGLSCSEFPSRGIFGFSGRNSACGAISSRRASWRSLMADSGIVVRSQLIIGPGSNSAYRQGLKPFLVRTLDVAAEAATHKHYLWDRY